MSTAREEILARISQALADAPQTPEVPRAYRTRSELNTEALIELHADRLDHYKAKVQVADAAELPALIAARLAGADSFVTPTGLPEAWLGRLASDPRRSVDSPDAPLSVPQLDATAAVVTGSAVSVAQSGTIVLDASPDQGRRAISLVPDLHVCVVPVSSIVELLPEAMERLDVTRPLTWIAGPSATSDIELERVEGVHGPRTLDCLLVRDL